MVKIVKEIRNVAVALDDVVFDEMYFYGIQKTDNGRVEKGFISRVDYESNNRYVARSLDHLTRCNCWWFRVDFNSIKSLVEKLLNHGQFEVFIFSNQQEFIKWLAE